MKNKPSPKTIILKSTALLLSVLLCASSMGKAYAQSDQLKSTAVAAVLALDPIPGDALYYAGKPVQGTVNLLVGGFGGFVLSMGIIDKLTRPAPQKCEPKSPSFGSFGFDSCGSLVDVDFSNTFITVGAILYVPMLLWDGIVGYKGVVDHNKKVQQQFSWLPSGTNVAFTASKGTTFEATWKF